MKLFVKNQQGEKIYLSLTAPSRSDLARMLGSPYFQVLDHKYTVDDVLAESSTQSTVVGAVAGALVGLLGGPGGMIVGGVIGGAYGSNKDDAERQQVEFFNSSSHLPYMRVL